MKRILLLTLCIFLWGASVCSAQKLPSFDDSFRTMRYGVAPQLRYGFDDYLQYSPLAVTVGLKAFGYESRSSWGRMVVSDAFSATAMVLAVNGLKYTVCRPRPDGTSNNSFPSGHTATAFMMASFMHKEYGWRSPWFSFGAYSVAAVTGISRVINDRHFISDVVAGAAIGVASVHLGYFIADKIFGDRWLSENWSRPEIFFDLDKKYYDIGLYAGYRFVLNGDFGVGGGSVAGLDVKIPIDRAFGVKLRAGVSPVGLRPAGEPAGSVPGAIALARTASGTIAAANQIAVANASGGYYNNYEFLAGAAWSRPFAKVFEAGVAAFAGYSFVNAPGILNGPAFAGEASLSVLTAETFKIKAFAGYGAVRNTRQKPFLHAIYLGAAAAFTL